VQSSFTFNVGNLDMNVLKQIQEVKTAEEQNRLIQALISKGLAMEVPSFEVKKIEYKGEALDGFKISSSLSFNQNTDLSLILANPFAAIDAINTLSSSVFSQKPTYWFEQITQKINKLKNIDDYLSNELLSKLKVEESNAISSIYSNIITSLLINLIVILITIFVTKRILKHLQEFRNGISSFFDYLEDSSKKVELIPVNTQDEFGEMSKGVNESIKVAIRIHNDTERLVNIMNHHVISSETDENGIITKVSEAFCKISGYSEDELMGQPHNIVRHEDMPKEAFEDMWRTIKAKKEWRGEVKNKTKDGGYYWVYTVITPNLDEKVLEEITKSLDTFDGSLEFLEYFFKLMQPESVDDIMGTLKADPEEVIDLLESMEDQGVIQYLVEFGSFYVWYR